MTELLNRMDLAKILHDYVYSKYKTASYAARKFGVDVSTISNYLHGRRRIPGWLLKELGYERIDLYVPMPREGHYGGLEIGHQSLEGNQPAEAGG